MRIAVVGGTGVVGRRVMEEARSLGLDPVSLSRASGVDLTTSQGLDEALAGCSVAIDASNRVTLRRRAARQFFEATSKSLQAAAARQGVGHIVILSIVGVDQARAFGYYDGKLTHERVHLDGAVPASVVRATQFHEFAGQVMATSTVGRLAFVPATLVQTVAARAVAARLVEVASSGPHRGRLSDVAGPDTPTVLPVLARQVAAVDGTNRRVVAIRLVGEAGRAVRSGALLPSADAAIVGPGFTEWLSGPDGPTVSG